MKSMTNSLNMNRKSVIVSLLSMLITGSLLQHTAYSDPGLPSYEAKVGVLEASTGASTVHAPDGREGWLQLLAVREGTGDMWLRIKLCEGDLLTCIDLVEPLDEGELSYTDQHGRAWINTNIDGLGEVDVLISSYTDFSSYPVDGADCGSFGARSEVLVAGSAISLARIVFNSQLGPWAVNGGSCGMNAFGDLSVAWLSS